MKDIISDDAPGLDGLIEIAKNKAFLGGIQFAAALPDMLLDNLEDEKQELITLLKGLEDE